MSKKIGKSDFVNADAVIARLPAGRRARIEARAKELIAEELTLRDLRKACELTQEKLARTLGVGQEQVSRLEQRSDMLLSTLASYVRAMGGDLKLVVKFPDRAAVVLTCFAEVFEVAPRATVRRRRRAGDDVLPR